MNAIEVGKTFPIQVNVEKDFCNLELWASGPVVIINFNNMSAKERRMFKESFKKYSYCEPENMAVPVAIWVFGFEKPFGQIEVYFNARLPKREIVMDYLEKEEGNTKNLWQFILLDKGIVQSIKAVGLHPEAVELFQATIRKQLAEPYTDRQFNSVVDFMCFFSSEEIMSLGKKFDLRVKK